jgi:drebrin-like protein
MTSLNLSANGPSISKSYKAVVDAPAPSGLAATSPTYAQWALFAVSAPLVNAFQQDAGGKESILKVQSTGGRSLWLTHILKYWLIMSKRENSWT